MLKMLDLGPDAGIKPKEICWWKFHSKNSLTQNMLKMLGLYLDTLIISQKFCKHVSLFSVIF